MGDLVGVVVGNAGAVDVLVLVGEGLGIFEPFIPALGRGFRVEAGLGEEVLVPHQVIAHDLEGHQVQSVALGAVVQIGGDEVVAVKFGLFKDVAQVLKVVGVLEAERRGKQHQRRALVGGQRGAELLGEPGGDVHLDGDAPLVFRVEAVHQLHQQVAVGAGEAVPELNGNGVALLGRSARDARDAHDGNQYQTKNPFHVCCLL